jgi:hypothetical protein
MCNIDIPQWATTWVVTHRFAAKEVFWSQEDADAFMQDKSATDGWAVQKVTTKMPTNRKLEIDEEQYIEILNATYAQGKKDVRDAIVDYLGKRIATQKVLGIQSTRTKEVMLEIEELFA